MQGCMWFLESQKAEVEADPLATELLSCEISSQYEFGGQIPPPHLKVILKCSSLIKLIVQAGSGEPWTNPELRCYRPRLPGKLPWCTELLSPVFPPLSGSTFIPWCLLLIQYLPAVICLFVFCSPSFYGSSCLWSCEVWISDCCHLHLAAQHLLLQLLVLPLSVIASVSVITSGYSCTSLLFVLLGFFGSSRWLLTLIWESGSAQCFCLLKGKCSCHLSACSWWKQIAL